MQALRNLSSAARRPAAALLVLAPLTAALLVACGGGGTGATSGTAGSQAVVNGTLTGFGSIFVNGTEYDTTNAAISDDEGTAATESDLKLGMSVQLQGTDPAGSGSMGSATTVVFSSDLVGPISAINAAAGTFTVLGQTVGVNGNTVWDTSISGAMAGITTGQVVKVFSLYDSATNQYVATRIELDSSATSYKIRGAVANLNTTTKTYTVGGLPIDYSGVASVPSGLANGVIATAELQTTEGASAWMATGIQLRNQGMPGNKVTVHVRGLISTEANPTSFTLDGWPVDASAATFPDGQSVIVAGAPVQVNGIMNNGVLVASSVNLQKPGSHGGLDFQVHGPITSIDTVAQTFVLRGTTVSYAGNVTYTGGDATSLTLGTKVMVQGTLASNGAVVQASTIAIGQ